MAATTSLRIIKLPVVVFALFNVGVSVLWGGGRKFLDPTLKSTDRKGPTGKLIMRGVIRSFAYFGWGSRRPLLHGAILASSSRRT